MGFVCFTTQCGGNATSQAVVINDEPTVLQRPAGNLQD